MRPFAYLQGDPGRLPFLGHFRSQRSFEGGHLSVAGRLRSRGDVVRAFRAARLIESAVQSATVKNERDRHQILAATWQHIHTIDGDDLGTELGADLVILFAVQDELGIGISGMGLGGVWALSDDHFEPLVHGQHPLLTDPGRPEKLAGILTLDVPHSSIVGVPHDHPDPPIKSDWKQKCGVRP